MQPTGYLYEVTKHDILEYFKIPLPTIKISQLIIRQNGHPLGDWEFVKPTRKHKYFIKSL